MDGFDMRLDEAGGYGKRLSDATKVPAGYTEDVSGLVTPERLRRPSPEVQITGRVEGDMFRRLNEDLSKIEKGSGSKDTLDVTLASFGGDVYFGFAIFDRIRQFGKKHHAPVTITGYGPIMSMGAFILQAGDIRRMPESATMLIHPMTGGMSGNTEDVEFSLEQRKKIEKEYQKIVAERVSQARIGRLKGDEMTKENIQKNRVSRKRIRKIMYANGNNGTYFTAREALDFGLIDEIV